MKFQLFHVKQNMRIPPKKILSKDANISEIRDQLQQNLGTKVIIKTIGVGGKIEIDYYSMEEFERLWRNSIMVESLID